MPCHNFLTDRDPKAQLIYSGRIQPRALRRVAEPTAVERAATPLFFAAFCAGTCLLLCAGVNGLLRLIGLPAASTALVWLLTGMAAALGLVLGAALVVSGETERR